MRRRGATKAPKRIAIRHFIDAAFDLNFASVEKDKKAKREPLTKLFLFLQSLFQKHQQKEQQDGETI
jgi:hypothetical protein